MNKFWKPFLALLLLTLLVGCTNFKDTMATSSLDNRESDRFKNMPVAEQEELPENSYTNLGEIHTKFSRPKYVTNYNLIREDARRSLKIKAVNMGGNAITGLKCERLENKGWQDELTVRCSTEVIRINSREALQELRNEPVMPGRLPQAEASNQTASEGKGSKFGVGWLSRYGVIVTNYHTVKGSENIFIRLSSGKKVQSKVLKQDPGSDIAILEPEQKLSDRKGLPLADFKAKAGDEVFVLGFPASSNPKQDPRIVKGVLNSTSGYRGDPRTYRINASLEKGYSGSPLLNPEGMVLGVVIQQGSAPELFPGQQELSPDEHYAVKIGYLSSVLDGYSKFSSSKGEEKQISTLRENIFTVIAE